MLLAIPLLLSAPDIEAGTRLPAHLMRVVDGDTLRLDLELQADVTLRNQAVRILGIDAPEMRTPEGRRAKGAAEKFLAGKKLEVELHGKDKYGRWLGDVFADDENLALWLLKNGHVRPYQIGRKAREQRSLSGMTE
jgi:micrococcal nuclease